jgi:ketosteroid isomerase-like protein
LLAARFASQMVISPNAAPHPKHSMSQAFIEVIDWLDATYEALSLNDIDLFLSAFAPDARWRLQGQTAGLPFAGLRVGHDAIREMIAMIYADFKMRDFFIEDIIANETSAAVRWSVLATAIHTGHRSQLEVFDHIVLREGKIASLTQFFDTAAVADASGHIQRKDPC